ncbi:MAG: HAD family phosphatase [Oscillospiraceae bacterium]|nr:HAD family phosphatase [Oscillospiraceae bacterium]
MIRSIVFDMGGVMREYSPPKMLAQLGVPEDSRPTLLREVFGSPEWIGMDRGGLTEEEALEGMRRHLPEPLWSWAERTVKEWWTLPFDGMPGMADLARELKAGGYAVYMLSNAAPTLHSYFPRIPGCEVFDGLFVSADWKLLKPEPAIYEAFLRHFGLRAEECFFVDDAPANVDGARRAGMTAVMFCADVRRLRRELRECGVEVAAL